jgi:ABC-type polysaccharide/polyol phosphate export permease
MKESRKWSWVEFAVGFLNKKLVIFIVSTVIVFLLLFNVVEDTDPVFRWIMGGGWLLLGIIFMLSNSVEKAVENAKIILELKAGAQANLNTEMSKVIEAAKNVIQGGGK